MHDDATESAGEVENADDDASARSAAGGRGSAAGGDGGGGGLSGGCLRSFFLRFLGLMMRGRGLESRAGSEEAGAGRCCG